MIKASWSLIVVAVFCGYATAQEVKTEVWPEVNVYYKRHNVTFMRLAAGLTKSDEFSRASDGFLELDLQFGLKPWFRQKVLNHPDLEKRNLLTMRGGYAYVPSFADEDPQIEHRGIFEVTVRSPLFGSLLLSDRNRVDFRWIDNEYSTRYRNRLRIEQEFMIGGVHFNPYGSAEFFYDTRVHGWNRHEILIGTEFPFWTRYVFELYYARQNNRGSRSVDINAIGWVFQVYFGK